MARAIGIDLGTTNSVAAVVQGQEPVVIPNAEGQRLTPSILAITRDGFRLVGTSARRQAVLNPQGTVYSIKRFMGRRREEVGKEEKMVPYSIVGGEGELVAVEVGGQRLIPPEVSAAILAYLKAAAERYLGGLVTQAVVTVPAYFNDAQRQATRDAGRLAGLEVLRIINEPTAAALAYGLGSRQSGRIAIFDLGGGTFDISILEVSEGVFEVLSTNGDTHLGGDDFDQRLLSALAEEFLAEHGVDLRGAPSTLQRLREAAEQAKCELSNADEAEINLPFIWQKEGQALHLQRRVARAEFEALVADLVERMRRPCEQALEDAGLSPNEIGEVILVGGSTRVPAVRAMVRRIFGKEPNTSVNPDEVVALGAAIQAAVLEGEVAEVLLLDVTPLSLGLETVGDEMSVMVPRNTKVPASAREVFTTVYQNQPGIEFKVLQGESHKASENRALGRFRIMGLENTAAGVPQVVVTFSIDADGILMVSAHDLGSGRERVVEIQEVLQFSS